MTPKAKRIVSIGFTLFTIGIAVYKYQVRNDRKKMMKEANEHYQAGEFGACEKVLLKYTGKYPKQYDGWSFLGTLYLELEEDSLAEVAFEKSLAIKDDNPKALTGMGVVFANRGDYDSAESWYLKAIEADDKYGKAYSSLLMIELRRENYPSAVRLGEKALSLEPNDDGVRGNLMAAYHFNGQLEKRDSLLEVLRMNDYEYLPELEMLLDSNITFVF